MEDMVFVTGRHRARSSTNIAFYEGQAGAQVSFGVQVTVDVGSSVYWQVTRNIQGAMLSQGPSGGVCDAYSKEPTNTESSDMFRHCRTYLRISAYLSEGFA